ncbi:hypothetical protein [Polaromonas sp. YR568]|uniref:hypothetical protein n=1 Tax=Polaromonas sp. YR568 TaxID=1855301 RepID=UPI00398BD5D3
MARRKVHTRSVRSAVLIVGEGYAEVYLLKYIRSLYTSGNQGYEISIGNARGKGAGHIVEYTIRLAAQGGFNAVAALLDTDTDWTPAVQQLAARKNITLLASEPCLEAWLLGVVGKAKQGSSADQKRFFKDHFSEDACYQGVVEKRIGRAEFDAARGKIDVLDRLLRFIGA